jgi:hypothetical protein
MAGTVCRDRGLPVVTVLEAQPERSVERGRQSGRSGHAGEQRQDEESDNAGARHGSMFSAPAFAFKSNGKADMDGAQTLDDEAG